MALFKSALSLRSFSEEDSSLESLVVIGSPDATTISSSSNPGSLGNENSKLRAHTKQLMHDTANGHSEFVVLQRELSRFASKSRASRTNVLRLSLLPFLRRRLCEILPVDQELQFRVRVLESWWTQLLKDLHSNIVSGADKAAYYETISGLISRPEWRGSIYSNLLLETLNTIIPKICVPNLPLSIAAFAGKLLAYAYVHVPGVADCLLFSLRVKQSSIDRLVARSPPGTFNGTVPPHLEHLVACTTAPTTRPPAPFQDAYAFWTRNWFPDSGIFVSFLKHHYSLMADSLPADRDEDTHVASPGLLIIQAAILQFLDGFVLYRRSGSNEFAGVNISRPDPYAVPGPPPSPSPSRISTSPLASPTVSTPASPVIDTLGSPMSSPGGSPLHSPPPSPSRSRQPQSDDAPRLSRKSSSASLASNSSTRSASPSPVPQTASPPARRASPPRAAQPSRVDKLRIFCTLREILHNDERTVPYYQPFCIQFDRIIQTVATSVNVYFMNSCVKLCDFVEEWLNCVTIDHRRSLHQVSAMLPTAVDWEFWVHVAGRMLTSENCHTEIRAISLLFNIWPHIPTYKADCVSSSKLFNTAKLCKGYKPGLAFVPKSTSLLWDITEWILSQRMWDRYFCHWSPLVRSYYHRLICFRVASVGSSAREWISDYDTSLYHMQASAIVKERLAYTYSHCNGLAKYSSMYPCTVPSQPLPNRYMGIGINAAATQQDTHRVYMFDIFDNSAYYSDKRNVSQTLSPSPSIIFDSSSSSHSKESDNISVQSSVSQLRKVSSLSSMPSIQESVTSNQTAPDRSPSETQLATPKKWGIFRKLLSTPPNNEAVKARTDKKRTKKKHQHRFADPNNIPAPWQLSEPCPEVHRPLHRFSLGPSNESSILHDPALIAVPFMPFEAELDTQQEGRPGSGGVNDNDLTYWNYGCRALAEWNSSVTMFEQFLECQRGYQATSRLSMPFMVAEIPWRAIG